MSSSKLVINSAHAPGYTSLVFSPDGSFAYTGGSDSLVRIWRTDRGADHEPDVATEAAENITALTTSDDYWLSGSEDSEVRRYLKGKSALEGLVTSANGVAIRSLAIDPKGKRVAVSSDELTVKLVDLDDTTDISVLEGHTKCVRKSTWHPSGNLLSTSGADGKIIIWNVSEREAKIEKVMEGIIPAVSDTESEEFSHDCSILWHASGQYFYVATRTHEIVTISRHDYTKTSTFTDDEALLGPTTALALSPNGVYLASASKAGVFIWSTQNRRVLFRHPLSFKDATVTSLHFSPSTNLLAWTDTDGVFSRWPQPIPPTSPDPVKLLSTLVNTPVPIKRKRSPGLGLFDDEGEVRGKAGNGKDDEAGVDLDDDDWILDDLGGGLKDDEDVGEAKGKKAGWVKEMVSVTKAQPPFQPGSTPFENKKRYLVYNMIGVIEVTDQDTHQIVNVEFHDRSARKSHHFTDHFRYDLASLGERGALYACQPDPSGHAAHVIYKPYGTWSNQSEWTYDLPPSVRVFGIAAGGPPPTKSQRLLSADGDLMGLGNVVIATSDGELTFLSGTGIERYSMGLEGDFVSMVAGTEWVFVVTRDGATTIDGSQNLRGTLIDFEDFSVLQDKRLPIPKGHTLKWIGTTEEGAPAMYDSTGVLHVMPRFRIPLRATWARILDTKTLERREGKDESYWPVGITEDMFMCLILKGRQEHPGFPRPLIQELPLRLPFRRTDPKEAPLEEHFARETMSLNILRDALGDDLISDDISRRELALDKELVQLIQHACKNDRLPRALDLTRMLHHVGSFDMAIKVAGFYHLMGLQEKMETLKEEREAEDRLESSREKRRVWARDSEAVPASKLPNAFASMARQQNAFQDFGPPPAIPRPGLARATPNVNEEDRPVSRARLGDEDSYTSPPNKRKRAEEEHPIRESEFSDLESGPKRRAPVAAMENKPTAAPKIKSNPFAKKQNTDSNRNPFARKSNENRSLHKSDSFFDKVEAAETTEKGGRNGPIKVKGKEKKQMTLFGLPPGQPQDRDRKSRKKKGGDGVEESQSSEQTQINTDSQINDSQMDVVETQDTEMTLEDSQLSSTAAGEESQTIETQTETVIDSQEVGSPEPIEWPPSPPAISAEGVAVDIAA